MSSGGADRARLDAILTTAAHDRKRLDSSALGAFWDGLVSAIEATPTLFFTLGIFFLINLVATGEGIMLEAQFLFEEAMARLRSASLAARVVARRVGFPMVELVAAWSKAHPSPLVADFLKTLESVSRLRKGNAGRSSQP